MTLSIASLRSTIPLLAVALAVAILPTAAGAQAISSGAPPTFRVGDAVRITVWNNPELSGEYEIAEDGTIIHPLYRSITIAGLTHQQIEAEFRRVLLRFETNPEIVVVPLFRIPVSGEVRSPNIYTLPPQASLMEAVVQAGGPTERGDLRRVRMIRGGQQYTFDLRDSNSEFADLRVRSGDQIIIPRTRRLWADRLEPTLRTLGSVASIAVIFLRISDRL